MNSEKHPASLELLAPAANADIAIEAILHGADAVYIGAPSHGARHAAANSIEEIRRVVDFAHIYRAKVYVTVNTIVYDDEIAAVEKMVWDLWRIGVDAIIVQDMALLRMDLPPVALHASTQCDTRTPAKARFLEEAGFSQIVLARELGIEEIREICEAVSVPVECFVHGALCVSYSGVCHASQAVCGRSANRGECAQLCRLSYDLVDSSGRKIREARHLLSLKDLNQIDRLEELVKAGVKSFKIEGRLKELGYVKNVTAAYSRELDRIVARSEGRYIRSSFGRSEISFEPDLAKSFNRGFTHYFLDRRRPKGIWEPRTPKSIGESIRDIRDLNNGDGISWFDASGGYQGMNVNAVTPQGVRGRNGERIPKGVELHRTYDRIFSQQIAKPTATRKLDISIRVGLKSIEAEDERGVKVSVAMPEPKGEARKPLDIEGIFSKTGNTPYKVVRIDNNLPEKIFIPASELTAARRMLTDALDAANLATYPLELRRKENPGFPYPDKKLDYKGNVANHLARDFYRDHGVTDIEDAMELRKPSETEGLQVMTTRHCILRELGKCKKEKGKGKAVSEPLFLDNGRIRFRLGFDCARCEMQLFKA